MRTKPRRQQLLNACFPHLSSFKPAPVVPFVINKSGQFSRAVRMKA